MEELNGLLERLMVLVSLETAGLSKLPLCEKKIAALAAANPIITSTITANRFAMLRDITTPRNTLHKCL